MKILDIFAIDGQLKIPVGNIPKVDDTVVLSGVLDVIYFIVGAFAVIVIVLAGFTFVTAGGDPAKITKARMAILYSVIGLIVVMFAFVITGFILGRF